jgi:acylaminoacyl-peptidase
MAKPIEPEDLTAYVFLSEPSLSPDGTWASLSVHRALLDKDEYEGNLWLVPLDRGEPRQLTTAGKDSAPKVSPDGKRILFTSRREMGKDDKGNGLYLIPTDGGEARLLLRRKEGISAVSWHPDGAKALFISSVGEEQEDVKTIRRINFWFNDKGFIHSYRSHVFVLDLATAEAKQATSGELDVEHAAFSHDGTRIAYVASTDDLRPYLADIFVLDLATGTSAKLTKTDMSIDSVAWSPDDRQILFLGTRLPRGFASHEHLWLIDVAGGEPRQLDTIDRGKLNSLNCDVRMGGVNAEPKWVGDRIYFLTGEGAAVHLHAMHMPDGRVERLVDGKVSVEAFAVANGRIAFTAMEDVRLPELYAYDGEMRPLTAFNERATKDLDVLKPEAFIFKASDGATIDAWVLRPRKEGKAPAILYIHGGPKTAFGVSYMHEFQVFAAKGYAVLYANPRGSDGYTEAFADIRGHYGERDYEDLMEAVDAAEERFDFIDSDRLAVAGGSYGGFMTNWVVTQTARFKAAVTDRSISNWWTFWGTSDIGPHFTKDQIGVHPWEQEEPILAKSPLRHASKVTTPLMLVHSFDDLRCWHVEALQFFTALRYLGKEAELVLFPKENHDLSRGGKPKHRVERLKAYLRWFDGHLK